MKITPGHVILPIIAIIVGALLVYVGIWGGWGLVWAAGGVFFITIGVSAFVLTLAWRLQGRLGELLRHPLVSILILCAIIATMCTTVYLSMINQFR